VNRWLDRFEDVLELAGTWTLGVAAVVVGAPRFLTRYRRPDPSEWVPMWFQEPE